MHHDRNGIAEVTKMKRRAPFPIRDQSGNKGWVRKTEFCGSVLNEMNS
jgi:hypothetical protein